MLTKLELRAIVMQDNVLIHTDTYAERLEAFSLLVAASDRQGGDSGALRRVAGGIDGTSALATNSRVGVVLASFADLLRIVALLVEWRRAVLDAAPEADRFKRGALERLDLWKSDYQTHTEVTTLHEVVSTLGENIAIAKVGVFCMRLAMAPLPVGIYGNLAKTRTIRPKQEARDDTSTALTVAFLSFTVDGAPADQIHFLTPHEMHDLEIEVRISRWPADMAELHLSPVSIELSGAYEFPDFHLPRPDGDPPYVLRQRGRAVIKVAQAVRAQPFEFRYAAEFLPKEAEQPVSIVGHRTLRIESVDFARSPLTGFPAADQKLFAIRNTLRRMHAMSTTDLESSMALALVLASLAVRSVRDNLFPSSISEREFQMLVRDECRRRPEIADQLEEHAHAGGGETDLSFRGIRLELKVEPKSHLQLNDCQRFIEQAAAYTVGSGKRVGLLSVLNFSRGEHAPHTPEDGIGLLYARSGVPIVTILIQGGLVKPSTLSR